MVSWHDNSFYIDDEPIHIFSGSIHYFRSLKEQWRDLLYKLKCAGLNTVETYCCWNLHEENEGEFCFDGNLDIEYFISLAQELGLYVILRPGPYICAEWEFGGLPGWLLSDDNIRPRTEDNRYLSAVKNYFDELIPRIIPHLQTNGGNIILMAVENEYGSFGNSTKYMNICAEMLLSYGIDVPLVTADGHSALFLDGGHTDKNLMTLDFGYDNLSVSSHFNEQQNRQPNSPMMHMEHWIGAISHWGEPLMTYDASKVAKEVRNHLNENIDFNLYMFHGGTNFAFTNGANDISIKCGEYERVGYNPDVTSYDYGAPLTEWGECTDKYFAIQKEMEKYYGYSLPKPKKVPVQSIGDIKFKKATSLFSNLDKIGERHFSPTPRNMEHYKQNFGYILYRTKITTDVVPEKLVFGHFADRVSIYFDGIYRGTLYRNDNKNYISVGNWFKKGGVLDLLVENMGRINFGPEMCVGDRKGLLDYVYITYKFGPRQLLHNWDIYTLPMKNLDKLEYKGTKSKQPTFYKGYFSSYEKKDCFVHPTGFTKGFIVVNGFNLGRFWNIGPQMSLYLPWPILKDENEIIVYNETDVENPMVSIKDYHTLDSIKTEDIPETVV